MNLTFQRPPRREFSSHLLDRADSVFIGGRCTSGKGGPSIAAIGPRRVVLFAQFSPASTDQFSEAAEAAAQAFELWQRTSGTARAGYLRDCGRASGEKADAGAPPDA